MKRFSCLTDFVLLYYISWIWFRLSFSNLLSMLSTYLFERITKHVHILVSLSFYILSFSSFAPIFVRLAVILTSKSMHTAWIINQAYLIINNHGGGSIHRDFDSLY